MVKRTLQNPKYEKCINFRMTEEECEKLDQLCRFFQISRSEFLRLKINQEYDAIQGNPQLSKMLDTLQEVARLLDDAKVDYGSNTFSR